MEIIRADPKCKCVTYVFASNQHTKVRKLSCDTLVNLEMILTDLMAFKNICKGVSFIPTKDPLQISFFLFSKQ
jgi:hypothetical protein